MYHVFVSGGGCSNRNLNESAVARRSKHIIKVSKHGIEVPEVILLEIRGHNIEFREHVMEAS